MAADAQNIPIRIDSQHSQRQFAGNNTATNQQNKKQQQQQQKEEEKLSAVDRLRQLEAEISIEAAGMRLPDDDALTKKLGEYLTERHPRADLQITVSSVRRTITTKQQYETETPGMVGLPVEKLLELQRKLMEKISANKLEPAKYETSQLEADDAKQEEWARRGPPEVQHLETVQESFPLGEDTMVTKKREHTLSTSQSRIKGLDDFIAAPASIGSGSFSPASQVSPATTKEATGQDEGRHLPSYGFRRHLLIPVDGAGVFGQTARAPSVEKTIPIFRV